jgi:signal transduction histidine kinase
VAHEINNPVNFIYGNLNHVNDYTHDLLTLVETYQSCYPNPSEEVAEQVDAIDLDFLTEDLPKTLTSMKVGADRIRQIVLSLRNFSRLDRSEMIPVNIHEGLDSTLLILQHRLKAKPDFVDIKLVKNYGDLPMVECYAGQLNQVFMNVINNAIDALEEHLDTVSAPMISIRTERLGSDRIVVCISDNGRGIPEDVKDKVFETFFTTKPIGKGTGMGLSISHEIVVEKHRGVFKCHSQPGHGTEFWIEIPIHSSQ